MKLLLMRVRWFWRVYRDPRTPLWSKVLFTALAVAYLAFPFDVVPDFVPFAGLLDDAIMVPFLMWLSTRFAPALVRRQAAEEAKATTQGDRDGS